MHLFHYFSLALPLALVVCGQLKPRPQPRRLLRNLLRSPVADRTIHLEDFILSKISVVAYNSLNGSTIYDSDLHRGIYCTSSETRFCYQASSTCHYAWLLIPIFAAIVFSQIVYCLCQKHSRFRSNWSSWVPAYSAKGKYIWPSTRILKPHLPSKTTWLYEQLCLSRS
jgi:hypothetical protein